MQEPDAAATLSWLRAHEFKLTPWDVSEPNLFGRLTSLKSKWHKRLDSQTISELGNHLAQLTSLQALNLSYSSIGAEGAEALAPHLAKLTSLRGLWLESNSLGDEGVRLLRPHLAKLTCLQELYLGMNNIGFFAASRLRWRLANVKVSM